MRMRLLAALVLVTILAPPSVGALHVDPIIRSQSRIWVEGGSTLRNFTCTATTFTADVEIASPRVEDRPSLNSAEVLENAEIRVPVNRLDCGNGTINGHMRNALRAAENPEIRFRIASYELVPRGEEVDLKLDGSLWLGDAERSVTVDASARVAENGTVQLVGSKDVRLSEFGIRAPSLLMGTLRVHDQVRIGFDLVFRL